MEPRVDLQRCVREGKDGLQGKEKPATCRCGQLRGGGLPPWREAQEREEEVREEAREKGKEEVQEARWNGHAMKPTG